MKPGEIIPVDTVILEGTSSIDESSLTGESLPVEKNPGEELLSGSVNGEAVLTVRALRTAENSQYAQIVELVKAVAQHKHRSFVSPTVMLFHLQSYRSV